MKEVNEAHVIKSWRERPTNQLIVFPWLVMIGLVLTVISSWRYISSGHQTRQGRERLTHPNPGLCLYLLMVTLLTGVLSCLAVTHDRNPINQDTRPLLMAAYLLRAHGQDTHKDTNLMTPDHQRWHLMVVYGISSLSSWHIFLMTFPFLSPSCLIFSIFMSYLHPLVPFLSIRSIFMAVPLTLTHG